METVHAARNSKAVCPLKNKPHKRYACAPHYSTKSNLQIHLKKHHKGAKIEGNSVRGREIEWVYVDNQSEC